MGAKLFAWLGGLAAFLAVAFFVRYSFEHDIIPVEVRVAIGFVLGAGLIVGGLMMKAPRFRITAQVLCATGVVSLYAVRSPVTRCTISRSSAPSRLSS